MHAVGEKALGWHRKDKGGPRNAAAKNSFQEEGRAHDTILAPKERTEGNVEAEDRMK
jgi:hypothetical protein